MPFPEYIRESSTPCEAENFLTKFPTTIINQILRKLDPFDGLLRFVQAYENHPILGPLSQKYMFTSKKVLVDIKNQALSSSPEKLLKKIQQVPIYAKDRRTCHLFQRFACLVSGVILDILWETETAPSLLNDESGNWHHEHIEVQRYLAAFIIEAPQETGVLYLKEAKLLLPDRYYSPMRANTLIKYLKEFNAATNDGHRKMVVISAFVLSCIYTFNVKNIRVRIFSDLIEVYHDMSNDEHYMGADLWDEYADFEKQTFWEHLNTNGCFSSRRLIANAMCTKMDLASAMYHNSTSKIEIYG